MAALEEVGQDAQPTARSDHFQIGPAGLSPRTVALLASSFLAIGLTWRALRYLLQFPIWGDEGLVLIDIVDCDYYGLTQTLPIMQIAPILFLWLERAVWECLGASELAIRLPAFVAGCGGLLMVAWSARRFLTPLHGLFTIAILAVSYWPVRHGCEVKPYAIDLLVSATLLHATLSWRHDAGRLGWLIFLALWTPLAILASYPAAFVAGGMSLAMLPKVWSAGRPTRAIFALFNLLMVAAFVGHYFGVTRNHFDVPQLTEQSGWLRGYFHDGFPPASVIAWPLWMLKVHASTVLAYPVGGSDWVASVSLLLAGLGGWRLWSQGRRFVLLACVAPFALSMFAALLHKYPFGASPRLVQHLAPMACVLIGSGIAAALEWARSPALRGRWTVAACLALALFGIGGMIRDVCRPYKAEHEMAVRALVQQFRARRAADEPVLLLNPLGEAPVVAEWYLRDDPGDIRRPEAIDAAARSAWLVRFSFVNIQPRPSAEQVLGMLGDHAGGWTIADSSQTWLPPGGPGDPAYYCTLVRIVRDR